MAKEIVKKEDQALAISTEDLMADSGAGGKVGMADLGIPFLYILQGLSPQIDPTHPKYIEGAQNGMLYVSVMEKLFDGRKTGLNLVPCFYERLQVEWKPREIGGGIVGSYEPGDPIESQARPNDKGVPELPNGNILQETAYWYCLADIDGAWKQLVFPWKSTFLKHSRKWNNQIMSTYVPGTNPPAVAPRWLYTYNCKSQTEENNFGRFNVPLISKGEMVSKPLYDAAKDYFKVASAGLLRRKVLSEPGTDQKRDDEVPF